MTGGASLQWGYAVPHDWRMAIPPSSERAYTYIDHATVIVGNRWIERRWSAFMGASTHLIQKAGPVDWAASHSPDIRLVVDGLELTPMTLGEVAWSEETSPFGATLVATWTVGGLVVEIRSFAFHGVPAMVRSMTLTNVAGRPRTVDAEVLDAVVVRPKAAHLDVETNTAHLAGNGLAFAAGPGVHVTSTAHARSVLWAADSRFELAPRTRRRMAPACLVAMAGGLAESAPRLIAEALLAWEEAECAAERLSPEPE